MLKTGKELQEQAKKMDIGFIRLTDCSICNFVYGYHIDGDIISFDTSCGCATSSPRIITWDKLAETYNMNQPENNPNISQSYLDEQEEIWEFAN